MKYLNILFVFVLIALVGCAGFSKTPTQSSPCFGLEPGDSQICEVIPNPQDVDFMLRLANAAALDNDIYKAAAALRTVDNLIDFVDNGLTYATFYRLLIEDTNPLIFVVVEEYSGYFYSLDMVITPTDVGFIKYHLNKQRQLILMSSPVPGLSMGGAGF